MVSLNSGSLFLVGRSVTVRLFGYASSTVTDRAV